MRQTKSLPRRREKFRRDQEPAGTRELPWTGERFVPNLGGQIALEHLHRYAVARSIACDKVILDIGCGEGYGPNLLAQVARYVVGVDVSHETVEHAINKYRRDNLVFVPGNCAEIPVATASIDLAVSFETLEHHDQHGQMIDEIKRVLRPGGLLIISTPDKYEYSDAPKYTNRFHAKELYRHEFEGLLKSYFKNVTMLGQRVTSGSYIVPLSHSFHATYRTFSGNSYDIACETGLARPIYIVAVASDGELPDLSVGLFEGESDLLAEKDRVLAEKDRVLAEKDGVLAEKERVYAEKDRRLAELNRRLVIKQQQLSTIRQQTLAVQQSLGWKMVGRCRQILNHMLPPSTWQRNIFRRSIGFLVERLPSLDG